MAKNKEEIEALKNELKGYELYGKADRAKAVKEAIKAAGGKVETKTAKPKAEKKVEKKK
jgi:glycine cleavage system aminomethyltransferase T|tara:strand:+ start:191 stop:367 length:177 start_codon:yes stop_codon:yes gene_type:complete